MTKVCVCGLWHLGSVTSACLASIGYQVIGFDKGDDVVRDLNQGRAPVFEPGLDELILAQIQQKKLRFTSDVADAVNGAQFVFITHDTRVDDEDCVDISDVVSTTEMVAAHLQENAVIIVSSQIPVGTGDQLSAKIRLLTPAKQFGFAIVPENLRLGQAIANFRRPAMVVIGAADAETSRRVESVYSELSSKVFHMDLKSAEMVKHGLNAFLATSVSFINELANLCDEVGADAMQVSQALRADERIGPYARLQPGGLGFAGATLARDVRVLQGLGNRLKHSTFLMDAVFKVNEEQKRIVARRLTQIYGSLRDLQIGVLGLTYKPGTSTLRRSVALEVIEELVNAGAKVRASDPQASPEEVAKLKTFEFCADPYDVAVGSDAMVIVTEWPQFRDLDFASIARTMRNALVIDTKNILDPLMLRKLGFSYVGIGRGSSTSGQLANKVSI